MYRFIKVFIVFQFTYIGLAQGSNVISEVIPEIERINTMREGLVSGVQGDVSPEIFKAVCMPVGQELKKLSSRLGVKIKQASMKYRNPNHKPNNIEEKVLKNLADDKSLISLRRRSKLGTHYFRRIDVQKACLNCHGSKASRPQFIKKKYPMDKAFGFKVGDLRGVYSVFISDKKPSK